MKKKVLLLDTLRVNSFVTSLQQEQFKTIVGGMKSAVPEPFESNIILNGCDDRSCPSDHFESHDQANSIRNCDTGQI